MLTRSTGLLKCLVAVIVLAWTPVAALAQTAKPVSSFMPVASWRPAPEQALALPAPQGQDSRGSVRLTLREAVQMAIAANPEVKAERLNTQRSEALLQAARGAFDPVVRLGGDVRRETRPSSSVLEAPTGRVDEHVASGSVGIAQRLPWNGASIEGVVENTRFSSTNPFLSLNPSYTPRARFNLNLPLLRGAGVDTDRTELRIRQREVTASRADLEARLTDLVSRVTAAYWQLVAARQGLGVAEQTRQAASESLASTERLVREGEQAEAELAGARGQLSRAEEAVANATGVERQAQNALKALLVASADDPLLPTVIEPADEQAQPDNVPLPQLLQTAVAARPELRAIAERLRAQGDRVRLAANERLPRVDLQLGFVTQGLSGSAQRSTGLSIPGFDLSPPPGFAGGPWTGFDQIAGNRYPTYAAALRIELPLRNRAAEGRYTEARLAEQQARLQQDQARIQIALDVRQSVEALNAARGRMMAAAQAEQASADRLASELRLFREGQSTNLNLNVRQNELSQSRDSLVRARQGFNTGAADLLRATGGALTAFGVQIEEAGRR